MALAFSSALAACIISSTTQETPECNDATTTRDGPLDNTMAAAETRRLLGKPLLLSLLLLLHLLLLLPWLIGFPVLYFTSLLYFSLLFSSLLSSLLLYILLSPPSLYFYAD